MPCRSVARVSEDEEQNHRSFTLIRRLELLTLRIMALGNQAQEQPSHLTEFANAIGSPKTWNQALRDPIADESEKGDASIQNDAPPVDDVDGMAQTQSDRPLSSARLLIVGAGMTLTSIINGWSVMMTPIMLELLADGLDLKEHDLQWTLNSFLLPLVSPHSPGPLLCVDPLTSAYCS
jgi:hypothetical protein